MEKDPFIPHSFPDYLRTACSDAGTASRPGRCDSGPTQPPSPRGACCPMTTAGDKELALLGYLLHARNCARSFCTC